MKHRFAPAGIEVDKAEEVSDILQSRLVTLVDLSLALKHAHWNVIGPGFIGAHELIDEHVEQVRSFADGIAERIATLGGVPNGLAGFTADHRTWPDYAVGRGTVEAHLGALDRMYDRVVEGHRNAIGQIQDVDVVSTDLLTTQLGKIELLQWFVRAHIEGTSGDLASAEADSVLDAAAAAATADPLR